MERDDRIQRNTENQKTSESFGIRKDKDGVMFTAFYPEAKTVQIASDFNDWQPERNPMKRYRSAGVWKLKIPLPKGNYRYRYVVDGRWQQDPYNDAVEPNPYSEFNSLVQV